MTDIAIRPLQRTELPPSTVGAGKPPLSLADRSGEIGLALATAKFAGDRFNDVVAAKAANEHAEFQGIAAAEMEAFDTFVVSKPGASFEELEAERNKMVARIEAAGKTATTKSAQQSNKNWMLRNKSNIFNQTQTSMEAIRTRQALATFNVQRKNLITNFKDNELTDLYAGQVESGLMTKEFAKAQLAVDLEVLDVAERKVFVGNASQIGFEAWQATVTPEDPDGDLNAGFNAINAIEGLTGSEKDTAESELKRRARNRQAEDTLKLEAQQEEDLDNINKLLYDEKDFTKAQAAIEASSLDETTQGKLLATAESRALAIAKGVPIVNDRVEENRLYEKSLDIWRGTVTKREFDQDVIDNGGKLDDDAYKRVTASAANTLKSSQAEALSRAHREAGNLIVDRFSEDAEAKFIADSIRGLAPDVAELFVNTQVEERQLQFWSLSRYDAEVRQWIEENPDKLGKDFFQFSESLKHDYWNKSIDDLRKLRERTEGEFTAAAFLATNPLVVPSQDRPAATISTQAEYDKLPKGTRYVGPDGRIATKR